MLRPCPRVLTLAAVCLFAAACERSNPPQAREEVLPPEHLLDVEDVGMVEPRVTVMPAVVPVQAALMPSARVNVAFEPLNARKVDDVREAVIDVKARGLATPTDLTLELLQPTGATYEVRSAAVGGEATAEYHVRFIVPVAGTAIDRFTLAGVWHADFLLGGEPLATGDFELRR